MRHLLGYVLTLLGVLSPFLAAATPAPAPLTLKFDVAAVEGFLQALDRVELTDTQWHALAEARGAKSMVRNTVKYLPDKPPGGYLASLRTLASGAALASDPYYLADAVANAATIRTLLAAIRRDEQAMAARIAARLAAHWQGEAPVEVVVYLVIGGSSDGFVLDGETAPEFFIAIDKAGGDLAGLEQNIGHESVHVLQRQLAQRHCPQRPSIERLAAPARFLATAYEEGVANYLADPEQVAGEGEYIEMWRDRYRRNATAERVRENAWLHAALLDGLRRGVVSWETAYTFGFSGSLDSRLYFHGRERARELHSAGTPLLSAQFSCHPETFFSERDREQASAPP